MKKRIFSLLLALCLIAGMLPTVAYAYDNSGTIDSGEFNENVNNRGTINGGTFNGTVTNTPGSYINNGAFNGIVYNRGGCQIAGGTFHNTVNNDSASDYILGGTFYGTVNNNSGATIRGGVFNDTVNNMGTAKIGDGTFYSTVKNNVDSDIRSGTFYGDVENNGNITGGTFYGDVENNKTITGGTFYGAVSGSGTISGSAVIWTKLTKDVLESTYKVESLRAYFYRLPSGNYYLGEDISVDTGIDIGTNETPANVVLDLNGHELKDVSNNTTGSLIFFPLTSSTNTLTLMDSSSGKTGKVIRSSGTTVKLSKNAKLNANGGTIEGLVELVDNTAVIDNTDPSNVTVFTGWVSNYSGTIKGGIFYGTVSGGTIEDSAKVTVTFNSNSGNDVVEQKVLRGQKVTKPTAPTKAGYEFEGWYNDATIYDFNQAVTKNITLTARWKDIDKLTAPAPVKSDSVSSDKDGNVSVTIEKSIVTVNGKTEVTVSDSIANTILSKLASSSTKKVIINATTGKNTASKPIAAGPGTSTYINLPESAVNKLAEVEGIEIALVTDNGKVVLDKETIAAVAAKADNNGQVTLVIETVEQNNNLLKIELIIKTSNGDVTDFNKGNVKVTVAISEVLKGKKPVCVYIDEDGRYHKIGGMLNADGTFTFVIGHFSTYAIMAEEEADTAIAAQQKAESLAALADQKLAARSKLVTMKNGKKAVLITWYNRNGEMMDFDGVEIFRSTKRNSGYGKKPIFTSATGKYYNTAIKSGTRYYYRVRGYVIIDGQKQYTDYSLKAIRTVK